jgi:transcriptional regulator GlxA family with amidase domain
MPSPTDPDAPADLRHRIAVLAVPDVIPFELSIPGRIFNLARDPAGRKYYKVVTCSADGRPVRTDLDFDIHVRHGPEVLATADTVFVPSSHRMPETTERGELPPPLRAALAGIRPGTRIVSICTGSFLLAAAGLLDGRPATTHWFHAARLQRLFPNIRVNPDALYVDDGDILTSAGVSAGIDLCLHLLRRDHGSEVANQVARRCVVPPWRDGGQSQFIERPVPPQADTSTAPAREWMLSRLEQPVLLRELAERSAMSVRTFTRRFRTETGLSPGDWLLRQRVERARHLLEHTALTVEQIAHQAGFGTSASLRRHLSACLGTSPAAYRKTFGSRPEQGREQPRQQTRVSR